MANMHIASSGIFNDLLNSAVVSINCMDAQGVIRWANQAELDMLGYPAEEYIGRSITTFHVDKERAEDLVLRLAEGEIVHDFPVRLLCKNGATLDAMISARAAESNGMLHLLQFTRVTSNYELGEQSQAMLAAIVAASDDAIVSKSLEGVIRSWNAGAERLLGYSEEEMIGRSIHTIIPPELREEENNILAKIRAGERIEHFETVRLAKNGRRVELSLTVSPIIDARGNIVGASKVARDISAQKRAARALKASEERFRLMADAAPVLIWMTDTEDRATWFNRRWLDFTGQSMDESIRNGGWTAGLHPDERQQVLQNFRQHCKAHEHYTMEHRLRRADGEYRWLLVNALPLQYDDVFSGYIGSCVDITDRKQAEETLRLEDRRKTEFIATLAHELRNPLAPIRNALEILNIAEYEPELWSRSRDIIERQLSHMVRLVDDLLNISRINQDKLALRTERVELAPLIEQALETVQSFAEQQGHKIEVRGADQAVTLQADPVRLTQILSNLLSNACKFTPAGGDITLSVLPRGDDVFISVKDTGVGLAANEIHRIFDLFQQSEKSKAHSPGGLGIGLTLAKRLVEMHGGNISVSSPGLGQGTTFTINLPVIAAPVPQQQTIQPALDLGSQRILVVDDNEDSAETLAVLLRLDGHDVRVAYDGPQALQEAEQYRPNLILLDLGLPGLDGIEVCRSLRARPWGDYLSIIALTGWGQEEDREQSRAAGFDEHLVKPVSHDQLVAVLTRHAGRAFLAASSSDSAE